MKYSKGVVKRIKKKFIMQFLIIVFFVMAITFIAGCNESNNAAKTPKTATSEPSTGTAATSPKTSAVSTQTIATTSVASPTETQSTAQTAVPAAPKVISLPLVEFRDTANLYSIKKPSAWISEIKDGKYIYVHSPAGQDGNSEAIIWSAVLSGNYTDATALNMANYLVGQIKKDYTDFKREKIYVTKDQTLVEVVATYTKKGVPKKAVFTVVTANKAVLLTGYAVDADKFDSYETMMREILASYKLIVPSDWKAQLKLGFVSPVKLVDWVDPTVSRSMTAKVPQGWIVQVVPDCTTHAIRIYDPNNPANQIFRYSELLFYERYDAREATRADKVGRKQNCPNVASYFGMSTEQCIQAVDVLLSYSDNPVVAANPRTFVTEGLPQMTELSHVRALLPWSPRISKVLVLSDWQVDAVLKSMYDAYSWKTANIVAEFTEDGNYPAVGVFTVATGPAGIDGLWPASVVAYSTDPNKFAELSPALIESLGSFQYTPEFVSSCKKAMDFRSEVIKKNYETIQQTNDIIKEKYSFSSQLESKISEQRSDAILGIERVYNPDTGEVYSTYNGFYDDYKTSTEMFNMKNLRPLDPNEWGLAPLDGNLNIN